MQGRTTSRQLHEDVRLQKIRPNRRNLSQQAALVVEIQIALSENTSVLDKFELVVFQRMEWMRDAEPSKIFTATGCNREGIETGSRKTDRRSVSPGIAARFDLYLCGFAVHRKTANMRRPLICGVSSRQDSEIKALLRRKPLCLRVELRIT